MGTGSALLLVSGIAVGISAFFIHGCQQGDLKCWDDRDAQLRERFYWSGGLVLGGAVLGIASSAYSAHPVSRDELMGLIREHNAQIRNCYERQLKQNPMLEGNMTLAVRIAPSGSVDGTQVSGSLRDRDVFACVRNVASHMRFPPPGGRDCAVVQVPFQFTPRR